MTKYFRIIIIAIVFLLISACFARIAYAANDITDATDGATETQEEVSQEEPEEDGIRFSGSSSARVTSVNPLSSLPEANLGLNNVLSIILIAIGILIILLAIAILIRIKH